MLMTELKEEQMTSISAGDCPYVELASVYLSAGALAPIPGGRIVGGAGALLGVYAATSC